MTPDELLLIKADGSVVRSEPQTFAAAFYDTLFELDPDTRALFGDDLIVQRGKLVAELEFLIDAATASESSGDLAPFLERARDLGHRHVGYGVTGEHYATVGTALLAAISERVADWDEHHTQAWSKLYRLISSAMRDGATGAMFNTRATS